jgi:hypothetical protein
MPPTARLIAQDFDATLDETRLRRAHYNRAPAEEVNDLARAQLALNS